MDKELVVERSYLVAGKATSSKYLVIGSWINFPVTWGGARERWSEMARPRRVVHCWLWPCWPWSLCSDLIAKDTLQSCRETAAKTR